MFRGIHLIPADTKIDFMGIHKMALAFFLSLLIGTFVLLVTKGLKFGIDFVQRHFHAQGCVYRLGSVLLAAHGSPPKSHDAIAHVFVDGAPVLPDDLGHAAEQSVEHALQLFG